MTDALSAAVRALGLDLGAAEIERLEAYEALLLARAVPLGMVARADAARLRERHVLDCLRSARLVVPQDREALDLGSGAGLPGMVLAIARPELAVTLIESRRLRASFLELAIQDLELANVRVAAIRVENATGSADLCTARAFAPLERSWRAAEPLLRRGGRLVYFAGVGFEVPAPLPGAASVDVRPEPVLASSGPLVIMTRQ